MDKIFAELHCHTVASQHAYSTISEYAVDARKKGIGYIAITDHGPALPDGCHIWHFDNLKAVPDIIDGVTILRGVEANIVSYAGELDINRGVLEKLDWVIASLHPDVICPASKKEHTMCWERVAENPNIDVIGHSGDPRFDFDHETACRAFAKYGKIVEINNHSGSARKGSLEKCAEIVRCCDKYDVPVIITTDAHHVSQMGIYNDAMKVVESSCIRKELVLNLNSNKKALLKKLSEITGRHFIE